MENFTEFADFSDPEFVTLQPPVFGIRRRPVFALGGNDYLSRPNGLLNFMEVVSVLSMTGVLPSNQSSQVGGIALYVMMTTGKRDSKALRFLAGSACTFGFNGIYMMTSSMLSALSAYYLPRLFYYIVFQGIGAACYLVSSLMIERDSGQVALQPCGGWGLYFMLGATQTSSQRLLSGTAYTFSFNGLFIMISSFLSYNSAYWLPATFYFVLFQGTGALMYICTCIMIVRDSKEVGGPPVLGLMTGGVHSFHCAYATYKKYYQK